MFRALSLVRPMEFPINLHAIKSGWLIVYIEGSQVIFFEKYCISFTKDRFCRGKSADPNGMSHNEVFQLSLHCLSNTPLGVSCLNWVKFNIISAKLSSLIDFVNKIIMYSYFYHFGRFVPRRTTQAYPLSTSCFSSRIIVSC